MRPQLKTKTDLHIARKLWHAIGVLLIVYFISICSQNLGIQILAFFTLFSVGLDFLRLKFSKLNSIVTSVMKPILRKSEVNSYAGTTYLFTGALCTLALFPKNIVLLSLLCLACGDPVASYFGIKFGKKKIFREKTLEGSFAAFITCASVTAVFLSYSYNLSWDQLIWISPLCGLLATLAELIPIKNIDDNFTFPILSACFFFISFYFIGL